VPRQGMAYCLTSQTGTYAATAHQHLIPDGRNIILFTLALHHPYPMLT